MGAAARLRAYARLVRLPHAVFSLPFAAAGAFLAARGFPGAAKLGWIAGCVVAARTAAMAYNRYADRESDARNSRTRDREIPKGVVSPGSALLLAAASGACFVACAACLNRACLALSPLALAVVFLYSHTKRVTALSHFVLGAALAMSPAGAWIAVRGNVEPAAFVLSGAVVFWLAGFDILYACLDVEFDRGAGVRSVPAAWGVARALTVARACHAVAVVLLAVLPALLPLRAWYWAGFAPFAALLIAQHLLVRPGALQRVPLAAFTLNGWAAILFGLGACLSA